MANYRRIQVASGGHEGSSGGIKLVNPRRAKDLLIQERNAAEKGQTTVSEVPSTASMHSMQHSQTKRMQMLRKGMQYMQESKDATLDSKTQMSLKSASS